MDKTKKSREKQKLLGNKLKLLKAPRKRIILIVIIRF